MGTESNPTREAAIIPPIAILLRTVIGVSILAGLLWAAAARVGGWPQAVQTAGMVGAAVVGGVGTFTLVIMSISGGGRPRPISWWMTMWLASTVIRLFVTPVLTFVLYFAAFLNAAALTISVALVYLAVLLAEAIVLARHVSRVLYPVSPLSRITGDLRVSKGS